MEAYQHSVLVVARMGQTHPQMLLIALVGVFSASFLMFYIILHLVAPRPRAVLPSEKTYRTSTPLGIPSERRPLPCWYDRWLADRRIRATRPPPTPTTPHRSRSESDARVDALGVRGTDLLDTEPAELALSVVMPAYNEELRIEPALLEAVEHLDRRYGREAATSQGAIQSGYEIIVVDDGSTDKTEEVALRFAHAHGLHDVLRYVKLERNRGKGGSVTHAFRHVRGEYVLFADADGASRFSDLDKLIAGCGEVTDSAGRGVAIGSRAHLVGSDAVVQRSILRNFLMRAFHFVLTILTPPATSRVRDTQCGFKLFTRATLPHIVPFMHAEGWIFDIEMLMLAESAPPAAIVGHNGRVIGAAPGIRVAEVPIGWHEVPGSKLNVVSASIRMAIGLAVLRASWMLGVYRKRDV